MAAVRIVSSPVEVSQSTVLVGGLLFGFVLWLAVNNKLTIYWQFLTGGGASAGGQAPTGAGTGVPFNPLTTNPSGSGTAPYPNNPAGAGNPPTTNPSGVTTVPGSSPEGGPTYTVPIPSASDGFNPLFSNPSGPGV